MRFFEKVTAILLSLTLALSVQSAGIIYASTDNMLKDDTQVSSLAPLNNGIVEEQLDVQQEISELIDNEALVEIPEVSEVAEIDIEDWWNYIQEGVSYDIGVKMYRWPYSEPPSFSMGNGALNGKARLIKEDGAVYAEIDFQEIDMGSTIGHLTDFWYFHDQSIVKNSDTLNNAFDNLGISSEERTIDNFIDMFGEKCQYFYNSDNIEYIRFTLNDSSETCVAGLESDFAAMGRQLCVLKFDFTNAIELITGKKVEKVLKVGTPVVNTILSAYGDSFEISIRIPKTAEASDADIYYMISGSDGEDLSNLITPENKYKKYFEVSKEEAEKLGGSANTFNVYAVGVKNGYENSDINMKKITFDTDLSVVPTPTAKPISTSDPNLVPTEEPHPTNEIVPTPTGEPVSSEIPKPTNDPDNTTNSGNGGGGEDGDDFDNSYSDIDITQDGKYLIGIELYNSVLDQLSMGNSAFTNNSEALIITSGGKSVIQIATNPVSIPPYYSALQDMQFQNSSGQWQRVREIQSETITANDGTSEVSLTYLSILEFDLPNTSDEYIPVKINVPYTPMDNVVESDNGYIEARIKLDWDSLQDTNDSYELVPDTGAAAGSSSFFGTDLSDSEEIDFIDEDTGIKVTADQYVFPGETTFVVSVLESGSEYENAKTIIGETLKSFVLYTIAAQNPSGDNLQPATGVAKLYFPIGEEGIANMAVYRIKEETETTKAGKTMLEYELSEDGKYFVISVTEMGAFAIGESTVPVPTPAATAVSTAIPGSTESPDKVKSKFLDVDGHWAEEYIIQAVNLGLFTGVDEEHFAPNDTATRAMFVTVLGRLSGVQQNKTGDNPFVDVLENDYFFPYVIWAYENGVVSGTSDIEFSPDEAITREQIAAILYKFIISEKIDISDDTEYEFVDSSMFSDWAAEGINALAAAGILNGKNDGYFDPQGMAVRAEIAAMLVRFISKYLILY